MPQDLCEFRTSLGETGSWVIRAQCRGQGTAGFAKKHLGVRDLRSPHVKPMLDNFKV